MISTLVFFAIILLSLGLAVLSRRGHGGADAREFFVASGQFGAILFFFLAVGETYSITTMLGFPGGVYAGGDDFIVWFFGYVLLAAPVVYLLGPIIRGAGSYYGAATIPDFFRSHFDSRALEVTMAVFCILLLIPVGTTQFLGLQLVLASLGLPVPPSLLTAIAGLFAFLYVVIAGLRASAFVAILKDVLMMAAILIVGIAAIYHWQVGSGVALHTPVVVPHAAGAAPQHGLTFAISTMILQAIGFAMVPQTWSFILSARSGATIRRAQAVAPLYLIMYPVLMCVAYFARGHDLAPPHQDYVFIMVAKDLLPDWLVGVILAGITLAGLVMLSAVCLAIGPMVTRNLVSGLDGQRQKRWTAVVTAAYLVLSMLGMGISGNVIVALNNLFYFGISQTLPAMAAALLLPRVRASAIIGGMTVGTILSMTIHFTSFKILDLNPGLIGLVANSLVMIFWSLAQPRQNSDTVLHQLRRKASRDALLQNS